MMSAKPSYDVFLSYNSRDREYVQRVADGLKARKCEPFVDQWYLTPGHDWVEALERALAASRSVAVFIGPHEMGRWQQRERAWALDRLAEQDDFPVIPVLLPGCEPPLGFMKQLMWIDLRDDPSNATQLDALAAAIRGEQVDLEGRPEPRAMICPYRGLLAFREEDAEFFFGRDDYLQQLIGLVQRQPLVAIVGASGSGKSSLVSAGLIPALRKHGSGPVWDVVRMVPHVDPLYSLAEVLVPLIEPELSKLALERELNAVANDLEQVQPTTPLWGLANAVLRQQPGTERLLLFVDQWEELYTNCEKPERRERFVAELLEATARKNSPLQVVLTVRGDFYGEILQDRPLLDRIQNGRLDLGPMKPEELRSAIEGPAHNVGLTFQDGLVDRILQEAGEEPGRLPLLEFALEELWKRRDRAELTHAGYEDLGRDPGQKDEGEPAAKTGCLSRAIATYAESVYGDLKPDEQGALPALFRKLVRAGSKADEDTRRRASLGDLDETSQRVARRLADKRLLITTRSGIDEPSSKTQDPNIDKESDSVEVAHEELLRRWGRLKQWVNEDREFLLWSSRIDLKVEEFQRDGNSALLGGRPLKESKKFYPARRADLGDKQCRILDASLRAARRRKWLIWGSVSVAIVALATFWFWVQANTSVESLLASPPATIEFYLDQLEPYTVIAVPKLRNVVENRNLPKPQRRRAAYGLFRFNAAGDEESQFLLDSIPTFPKDEGPNLVGALAKAHERQSLDQELGQRVDANSGPASNRYVTVALNLGITDRAKSTCKLHADPSSRTSLIHGFKDFPGDLTQVARTAENADPELRSALCVAIGTLGPDAAEASGEMLKKLYVEAKDGGTHSAAGWALRQLSVELPDVPICSSKGEQDDWIKDHDWFVNSQAMTMIKIPEGKFAMGPVDDEKNPADDAEPEQFKSFWLSDREVSVGQFQAFVDATNNQIKWRGHDADYSPSSDHPVPQVSWYDAIQYCNWLTAEENKSLSEEEKLQPYYKLANIQRDEDDGWITLANVTVNGGHGYRLPTEREWEYACRAMSASEYTYGNEVALLDEYGVYRQGTTQPCGRKVPNGWGLFDMHGNVYEWCWDKYETDSDSRVLRGGSFSSDDPRFLRTAFRYRFTPGDRVFDIGFRVSRTPYQSGL